MASKNQFESDKEESMADKNDSSSMLADDQLDDEVEFEFSNSREERDATRSLTSRQKLHDKLMSDVEQYLANGGKIHQVDSFVNAEPPRRPVNKYGQSAI